MLYAAHELGYLAAGPYRAFAQGLGEAADSPANPMRDSALARAAAAGASVFERATRRYGKPEWGLTETEVDGRAVPVTVEVVQDRAFGRLLRFARDLPDTTRKGSRDPDPRVLIVAPMSGHYATLLRGTVQAMLPGHEVYITDWTDARDVGVFQGRFDLGDYVDYLIGFLQAIGPGAHAMAVCQPGPPLLAAAAVMARAQDPARPRTLTFMGSPIDARQSPTVTNLLAEQRGFAWFERNMIQTVPLPYAGAGRRVYPGFVQLFSFMSMNAERHAEAQWDYFQDLVRGDDDAADKHVRFYDEYLSVCDMTAEFYLQTIREVFQEYLLPRGLFTHRGAVVDPGLIRDTGLMTVEGELDDISGIGQTQAAHDLCTGISDADKIDYVQKGAGHYGVFNGSKWREHIQPKLAAFIADRFDPAEERALRAAMAEG